MVIFGWQLFQLGLQCQLGVEHHYGRPKMEKDELWDKFIASHRKPIKVVDFSGATRTFDLSGFITNGYTIVATESSGSDCSYEFSSFSYSSPHEAFSRLVEKIQLSLATRNLDPNNFPHLLTHKCAGRVASGGLVVDGKFIAWKSVAELMESYEGWEFSLYFGDN